MKPQAEVGTEPRTSPELLRRQTATSSAFPMQAQRQAFQMPQLPRYSTPRDGSYKNRAGQNLALLIVGMSHMGAYRIAYRRIEACINLAAHLPYAREPAF